jgi:hypothetical protein
MWERKDNVEETRNGEERKENKMKEKEVEEA